MDWRWEEQVKEKPRATLRFGGPPHFITLLLSPTYVSSNVPRHPEDSDLRRVTFWAKHTQIQSTDGDEAGLGRWVQHHIREDEDSKVLMFPHDLRRFSQQWEGSSSLPSRGL